MSFAGLDWTTLQLPLAAGLNQKTDDRARPQPFLDRAVDVQFDELGGLQPRYPFNAMGSNTITGGVITDPRRLVQCGDELLMFTKDALYSWSEELVAWVSKGTHLAVKMEEAPVFVTTGDQDLADRAELDGVIVYVWQDGDGAWIAASDKTTGAVLYGPALIEDADCIRPRVVALDTVILVFYGNTADDDLTVFKVRPVFVAADILARSGAADVITTASGLYDATDYPFYDVVRVIGSDMAIGAAAHATGAAFSAFKVTAGVAVSRTTMARPADGPLAVACTPDGLSLMVCRSAFAGGFTTIKSDIITISSLVDGAYTGTTLTTIGAASNTIGQVTTDYRPTAIAGEYRADVFWDFDETAGVVFKSYSNYVDTDGTTTTEAAFKVNMAIASRAFVYDGSVYVWGIFAQESGFSSPSSSLDFHAQLQNTYYLYRSDGFLAAKAATNRAGGFRELGILPGVACIDDDTQFAWCGVERRIIAVGGNNHTGYGDRAPRDIVFTFDSNEARRTAQLGSTVYVSGGEILQYDGVRLTEAGFHVFPWYLSVTIAGGGAIPDGSYAYKLSWRWSNARGETERSTTATVAAIDMSGGPAGFTLTDLFCLVHTHKTDNPPAVEIWRTAVNPTADSPFQLVTSNDPSSADYRANDADAGYVAPYVDSDADTTIASAEVHPENGGILENLAPPAATIIIASDTRLFLAGVAGDPDRVWYSKLRGDGEVAAFHDGLTIDIPREGGQITGLGFLNETLIVFRATSVFALAGDGIDNLGGSANYGPARCLSSDVGAINHESIALTPEGLIFKSHKGWYLLNRGWSATYIGGPVSDYDDEEVLSVQVVGSQHQIRCLTTGRMLVLDYQASPPQWAEWSISDGLDSTLWGGAHVYLSTTGTNKQATSYSSGVTYSMDVETSWIKLADLQGAASCRAVQILGEYRALHALRVRIAYDYVDTYVDDKYWTPSPTTVGGPIQLRHGPRYQKVQALKVRMTVVNTEDHDAAPATEGCKLTGLALEVGMKRGLYRRLPSAQRQ